MYWDNFIKSVDTTTVNTKVIGQAHYRFNVILDTWYCNEFPAFMVFKSAAFQITMIKFVFGINFCTT